MKDVFVLVETSNKLRSIVRIFLPLCLQYHPKIEIACRWMTPSTLLPKQWNKYKNHNPSKYKEKIGTWRFYTRRNWTTKERLESWAHLTKFNVFFCKKLDMTTWKKDIWIYCTSMFRHVQQPYLDIVWISYYFFSFRTWMGGDSKYYVPLNIINKY